MENRKDPIATFLDKTGDRSVPIWQVDQSCHRPPDHYRNSAPWLDGSRDEALDVGRVGLWRGVRFVTMN